VLVWLTYIVDQSETFIPIRYSVMPCRAEQCNPAVTVVTHSAGQSLAWWLGGLVARWLKFWDGLLT